MSGPRIAYVNGDPGIAWGGAKGASLHALALARALARAGAELTVFALRAERADGPAGCRVVVVTPRGEAQALPGLLGADAPATLGAELRSLFCHDAIAREIAELHAVRPFDFVYERLSLFGDAAGRFARKVGIPHVLEVNAPLVEEQRRFRGLALESLAREAERQALATATAVLAVSEPVARFAAASGASPGRIRVVSNGADLDRFHPGVDGGPRRRSLGWDESVCVVGFAGGLRPWHGVLHLLAAFDVALREEPSLRLAIVGDGPLGAALDAAIAERQLSAQVARIGAVPHDEVPAWLAACDVLAAPYEPAAPDYFSPLKIAEGLAAGRPVVASAIPGAAALVRDGETGLLVPPGDEPALASALVALARDRARRHALGAAAARDAAARFSWDHAAAAVLDAAGWRSAGRGVCA